MSLSITPDQWKILKLLHEKESKREVAKALLPENPTEEDIKRKIAAINKTLERIRKKDEVNRRQVNRVNNYISKGPLRKRRFMRKCLGFEIPDHLKL